MDQGAIEMRVPVGMGRRVVVVVDVAGFVWVRGMVEGRMASRVVTGTVG